MNPIAFADFQNLVAARRSFRRFDERVGVDMATLRDLLELARLCSSGLNAQPLRYVLSATAEDNARIFAHMVWGASLADWDGPAEGERPAAYIVMLAPTGSAGVAEFDAGIAAQAMLLGAQTMGLGGCMLGGFDRQALARALNVPSDMTPLLVLALGQPAETVVVEDARQGGDLNYWRDENDVHHVPKLAVDDVVVRFD